MSASSNIRNVLYLTLLASVLHLLAAHEPNPVACRVPMVCSGQEQTETIWSEISNGSRGPPGERGLRGPPGKTTTVSINRTIQRMTDELNQLKRTVAGVNAKLLNGERRVDGIADKVNQLERIVAGFNVKLLNGERRVDGIADKLNQLERTVAGVNVKLLNGERRVDGIADELNQLKRTVAGVNVKLLNGERRVDGIADGLWGSGGFTASNGFSYKITDSAQNFQDSRRVCRHMGGHLAYIGVRNAAVYREIIQHFRLKLAFFDLTDIDTEGVFRWGDGVLASGTWTNWNQHEPNNAFGNEDCAAFDQITGRNLWYDHSCAKSFNALCERRITS